MSTHSEKNDFLLILEKNTWVIEDVSLELHVIYSYVILYFFVDHVSIDGEHAEENALKNGSVHLPVYGIGHIIYG